MAEKGTPEGETPRRPRLNAVERGERAHAIIAAKAAGATWSTIAERFGISTSRARKIAAEVRAGGIDDDAARQRLLHGDPLEPVLRLLSRMEWIGEHLAVEVEGGDNSSARVGASNALLRLEIERLVVFVGMGIRPHPAEVFRYARARDLMHSLLDEIRPVADEATRMALSRYAERHLAPVGGAPTMEVDGAA